jgi:hypothetical protein
MNTTARSGRGAIPSRIELIHGDVACLECCRGQRLCVERGSVWVTQDGSTEDVCLETGGTFQVTRSGSVVATAIGRRSFAVLTVESIVDVAANRAGRMRKFWNSIVAPVAARGFGAAH